MPGTPEPLYPPRKKRPHVLSRPSSSGMLRSSTSSKNYFLPGRTAASSPAAQPLRRPITFLSDNSSFLAIFLAPAGPAFKRISLRDAIQRHAQRDLAAISGLAQSSKSAPPSPPPRKLAKAAARKDAREWKKCWDDDLIRHGTELRAWIYEPARAEDKPLPFVMEFPTKKGIFGGLERQNVRCAIRGDRVRSGLDFDEMHTASHMSSQSERRLLFAAAAAEGYAVANGRFQCLHESAQRPALPDDVIMVPCTSLRAPTADTIPKAAKLSKSLPFPG